MMMRSLFILLRRFFVLLKRLFIPLKRLFILLKRLFIPLKSLLMKFWSFATKNQNQKASPHREGSFMLRRRLTFFSSPLPLGRGWGWVLRIHHRLITPATVAAVAAAADKVDTLGVGEFDLAVLDALGHRGVA